MRKVFDVIILLFAQFYLITRIVDSTFKMRIGVGDEMIFRRDLFLLIENGYSNAIEHGISIPFTVLGVVVYKLTNSELMALRLIPLFSTILLFIYVFNTFKKVTKNNLHVISIISILFGSCGFLFYGTNDSLFFLGLTISFMELVKLRENEKYNKHLFLVGVIIAISTRPLFLMYLQGVLVFLLLTYKRRKITLPSLTSSISIALIFLILINIPIIFQFKLSYDNKEFMQPLTWTQRHYLSQKVANVESSEFKVAVPLVSWDYLKDYLADDTNPKLPKSTFEAIIHDPIFTMQEFFKDFLVTILVSSRFIGLATFFPLFLFFKKEKSLRYYSLPISAYVVFGVFSFVIISSVEQRWLFTAFITLIYFYLRETNKAKNGILLLIGSMGVGVLHYFFKNGLFFH